ncbi:MAG TPA: TRAM domain-containing protein [Microthrixaceae bacterium]|nr:TRAM domain-containing protein [Microthrixaceae bacterium]
MDPDRRILRVERPATGGESVGRDADGRATFVAGALPGELVEVEIVEAHPRFARGRLVELIEPAAERVTPPCPWIGTPTEPRCGGCDLQHAALTTQRDMKLRVVADALERIGHVETPAMRTVELPAEGFRTSVRLAVADGRAGYRKRRSHDVVVPDDCLVAHPLVEEILVEGRFVGCDEVSIRVGARTGERLVELTPSKGEAGDRLEVSVPDDVVVVGPGRGRGLRRSGFIHELVGGRRWRISSRSFFQSRPDGAEALIEVVRGDVARLAGTPERLADLYAGVGLFAGTVDAGSVVAVEWSRSSCADAEVNLGPAARVVRHPVDTWTPEAVDVVIADPAREGLGKRGVATIAGTGADVVVLVSCDAGSLGRDAGALVRAGYTLDSVTLVDLFPHTHHVEAVTSYRRG